jgi:hypothetical protein
MTMKHPNLIQAEMAYKSALNNLKRAESISEDAFNQADKDLDFARQYLVKMEITHPTKKQIRSENNYLYMANRGLC